MANNKIVFGNTPIIDLTGDTATTDKVVSGVSFMGKNGQIQTGTMTAGGALVYNTNISIAGKTYTPPAWSSSTDADIAETLELHYSGRINLRDFWNVGDQRTVSLSAMSPTNVGEKHVAQDTVYVLSHKGGKTLSTPINGISTCAFQVDQVNCLIETGYINSTGTSWQNSGRRTWCNNTYNNAIPSTLRGIFKDFINQTRAGSATTIVDTTDTFALRAEIEIFGTTTYSTSGEGSQVDWYKTASNRIKQVNGINFKWWERSPLNGYKVCQVSSSGTATEGDYSNYVAGIAPFGVI